MKIKIKRAVAFYIDWLIILIIVIGITLLLCLLASREFIEVFLKYFSHGLCHLCFCSRIASEEGALAGL